MNSEKNKMNYCRFCLIKDNFKGLPLDNAIETKFEKLTNYKILNFPEHFSVVICLGCLNKINYCLQVKNEFVKNQIKLIESYQKESNFTAKSSVSDQFDKVITPTSCVPQDENFSLSYDIEEMQNILQEDFPSCLEVNIKDEPFSTSVYIKEEPNDNLDENSDLFNQEIESRARPPIGMKKCRYCNKIFRFEEIDSHIKRKHKLKEKYFCDVCNRGFFRKLRVIEHVKTHYNIRDIPCEECDLKFATRSGMLLHKRVQHNGYKPNKKKYPCPFCEKICNQSSNLNEHIRNIHIVAEKTHECLAENCNKKFISRTEMKKHFETHNIPQPCPICDKPVRVLKKHIRSVHRNSLKVKEETVISEVTPSEEEYSICIICEKSVKANYLSNHIRLHLNHKKLECDICGRKFSAKRRISGHMKIHLNTKEFPCDVCGLEFFTRTGMLDHRRRKHEGINRLPKNIRTCEFCGLTFQTKQRYDHHIRSKHTGEREFKCDINDCGKAYFSSNDLCKHKKFFHGPLVSCPICDKVVKNLNRHNRTTHPKEPKKVVPCSYREENFICNKTFASNASLKLHIDTVHCDKKDFGCDECGVFYKRLKDLTHHKRNRHQNLKIKCELCSTLVTRKDYYVRHIKLSHQEMSEVEKTAFLKKIRETKLEDLILCTSAN